MLARCLPGSTLKVTMEWTLNRESQNPEVPKTVSGTNTIGLSETICNVTANVLESVENATSVTLPELMPKFLKITTSASAIDKLMRQDNLRKYRVTFEIDSRVKCPRLEDCL